MALGAQADGDLASPRRDSAGIGLRLSGQFGESRDEQLRNAESLSAFHGGTCQQLLHVQQASGTRGRFCLEGLKQDQPEAQESNHQAYEPHQEFV